MHIKRWLKLNKNKLYRKFFYSERNFVENSVKISKPLIIMYDIKRKDVINNYYKPYFKYLKRIRWSLGFARAERKIFDLDKKNKKGAFLKHLKKNSKKQIYKAQKSLKIKKNNSDFFSSFIKYSKNLNFLKKIRKKVYANFWIRKKLRMRFSVNKSGLKNKVYSRDRLNAKRKRTILFKTKSWISVMRSKKRKRAHWLQREYEKKSAFFYGFLNIRKFRNKFKISNKIQKLTSFYFYNFENMINVFLLKIGLFNDIFQANNFIKLTNYVKINGKPCSQPFKVVKKDDIVELPKKFNHKIKNIMINKKLSCLKLSSKRNSLNMEDFIDMNLFLNSNYIKVITLKYLKIGRLKNQNWSIDTKLKYNN